MGKINGMASFISVKTAMSLSSEEVCSIDKLAIKKTKSPPSDRIFAKKIKFYLAQKILMNSRNNYR